MFSSLRSRLWLSYALVIGAALGVVLVVLVFYVLRTPLLYRKSLDKLETVETLVLSRWGVASESQNIPASMERVDQALNVRLLFFSSNGQVLADSRPRQAALSLPLQPERPRLLPIERDEKGTPWLYRLHEFPDGSWLMTSLPYKRVPLLAVFRDELFTPFIQAGVVALLLALLLAYWIARWVADPLQRVVNAARNFPKNAEKPLPVAGPREVQVLVQAFNQMTRRMQATQKSQREFVANVSHELKTPLTSIQGFAQSILDGTSDTPQSQRQAASVIFDEAGRMHRMVLDLLDLARFDTGTADLKMGAVEVGGLLRAVAEKFIPQSTSRQVRLDVLVPPGLPVLLGDGDRLAQVFTNLVDNAFKFTPPGGQITLSAGLMQGEMLVEVNDTGIGISPGVLLRIFERFYQADAARSGGGEHGSGLGLTIAREIVDAHGGRITVRSQPGIGSTFSVHLPLSRLDASTLVRPERHPT